METSEKSGFLLVVIAALLYLGTSTTGMQGNLRVFILLLAACSAIWGAVLLVDWIIALIIARVGDLRMATGQPQLAILGVIARMTTEQIALADKLGIVEKAVGDYAGSMRKVYVSPWGVEIPTGWILSYLDEIETHYPRLRPIGTNPEGTIERNYNEEITNWLILWKMASRDTVTSVAQLIVPLETVRERLGVV